MFILKFALSPLLLFRRARARVSSSTESSPFPLEFSLPLSIVCSMESACFHTDNVWCSASGYC